MTAAEIVFFEELPQRGIVGRPSKYAAFYEALRSQPGRWAAHPGSEAAAYSWAQWNQEFECAVRSGVMYMRVKP